MAARFGSFDPLAGDAGWVPCINGQVASFGAYFGQDVRGIIKRLFAEQLSDGGWNCEAARGSKRSSFNTTICVLEALLGFELRVEADPEMTAARLVAERPVRIRGQ